MGTLTPKFAPGIGCLLAETRFHIDHFSFTIGRMAYVASRLLRPVIYDLRPVTQTV